MSDRVIKLRPLTGLQCHLTWFAVLRCGRVNDIGADVYDLDQEVGRRGARPAARELESDAHCD